MKPGPMQLGDTNSTKWHSQSPARDVLPDSISQSDADMTARACGKLGPMRADESGKRKVASSKAGLEVVLAAF